MNTSMMSKKIFEAGIVGAGGAGFPTHIKLVNQMEHIIVNGVECEPLLYTDEQLLQCYTEELIETLDQMIKTYQIQKGIIAIKNKYVALGEKLKKYAREYNQIEIKLLDTIYPMGDEITLIYEATGKCVKRGALPATEGVVVINVETLLNIARCLTNEGSVTHTYVTVNGEVESPAVYRVPIGTKIEVFLEAIGENLKEEHSMIMGGPMMGEFVSKEDIITKTTKGLIILPPHHVLVKLKQQANMKNVKRIMSSCSQCRMCTDLCPRNRLGHQVEPHKLMNAFANGLLMHHKGIETALGCCGCHLCSYFSCHHELSPGSLMTEVKKTLIANGMRTQADNEQKLSNPINLKVQSKRLVERLGLGRYKKHGKLSMQTISPKSVEIPLKQHIGQISECIVNVGDYVGCGDRIARPHQEGIGAFIHSSIDGIVTRVTEQKVVITQKGVGDE